MLCGHDMALYSQTPGSFGYLHKIELSQQDPSIFHKAKLTQWVTKERRGHEGGRKTCCGGGGVSLWKGRGRNLGVDRIKLHCVKLSINKRYY